MEVELDLMAAVIDEYMKLDEPTQVTSEIRNLAIQLRNLVAIQRLNVVINILQSGIQYTMDDSVITLDENQFETDQSIDGQTVIDEPIIEN
jgi:hypothetical protein